MTAGSRGWLVAADDRTGALEVAAELSSVDHPVMVATAIDDLADFGVVDLGSRDLDPAAAAARAVTIDRALPSWSAHKIDSTLRGNWVHELRARRAVTGARVLLLAGWPEMGRTCVDGIVFVNRQRVGVIDDFIPGIRVLRSPADLRLWLRGGDGLACCDVPDTPTLLRLADDIAAWQLNFLLAGPAGAIGAVSQAWDGHPVAQPGPRLAAPVLVVCGSAHATSHAQLVRLRDARPDVEVIAPTPHDGELRSEVAAAIATQARARLDVGDVRTLVIIGGETAAVLLGDEPRLVAGYAAPGMPWSLDQAGGGPIVITKAGSFGGPDALVHLLGGHDD